jgi:hypothetical protein
MNIRMPKIYIGRDLAEKSIIKLLENNFINLKHRKDSQVIK